MTMPGRFIASATVASDVMALRPLAVAAALLSFGLMAGQPAGAQTAVYAERFRTVCAACHGANGRSDMPGTPVLAGQHSLYAITQLFLFREGRRTNEAMIAIAKPMK